MDATRVDDIGYRIQNLRHEISNLEDSESICAWEEGYREGRQMQMESELRFLEGLLASNER